MNHRVKNIFHNSTQPVQLILIKNGSAPFIDENFFYVTGLEQGLFEGSCAVLYPDGTVDLLVSELEAETAKKATADLSVYHSKEDFITQLKTMISSYKTIGINTKGLSCYDLEKLKDILPQSNFLDVSEGFQKTRLIKDDQEIDSIKQACALIDDTIAAIPDIIYEGITEYELAAEINYAMQSRGAEKPAFDTISSFGKNTAEPHYSHGDITLKPGDFILCDIGACFKRYNSDITRMFLYGTATQQQKHMFDTVLEAQQRAFEAIRPGVIAGEIHQLVSSFIDSTMFKGRFIHSTGHSLGLAVHDGAGFAPDNPLVLKENMVFTVEPGIYLPGMAGVRIEDDVLITKDGIEILTKSQRELIELE